MTLATALAVLTVPGWLVGVAAGLRGWLLLGAGPALTLGVSGLLGTWFGVVGIPWNLGSLVAGVAVFCVVAAAVVRPWRRREAATSAPAWTWYHHAGVAATLGTGSVIGALAVSRGSRGLEGITQYWDAIFHANAVRFIAETDEASSAALAAIAQPANPYFYYPHTYHQLGALIYSGADGSVQIVLNALSAVTPAAFALSIVALLRVTFGRPTIVAAGGLVSCTFSAFPYDLINFGPLLPLALALAAAPGAVALLVHLFRRPAASAVLTTALGALGLLTTHPTVAFSAGLLMALLFVTGPGRSGEWKGRTLLLPLAVAAALTIGWAIPSLVGLLGTAGVAGDVNWPPTMSPGTALGQLFFYNHESFSPQWWLVVLTLAGLYAARSVASLRPYVLYGGFFLVLFMLASSYDNPVSEALTSFWWNDKWRFAALYVFPAAVVAAVGLAWWRDKLVAVVLQRLPRASPRTVRLVPLAATAAALVGFTLVSSFGYVEESQDRVAFPYKDGPTVSSGELEAYRELAALAPSGTVMNDPVDGSAWAYGLYGLPMVFRTPLTAPSDPEDFGAARNVVLDRFHDLGEDREVDEAIAELDIEYVIVGEGFASPSVGRAPGLEDLDRVPGLDLVWSNDVAQIYRLGGASPAAAS